MNVSSILCPVDFSEVTPCAIDLASRLAADYGATLHIVHVCELHSSDVPEFLEFGSWTEAVGEQAEDERRQLDGLLPSVSSVKCVRKFLFGNPARHILQYSEDESIDLIVVGSHGRSGISRVLLGSVAENVLRKASCPVIVVKRPISAQMSKNGGRKKAKYEQRD